MTSRVGVPSLVWTKLEPPVTRRWVRRGTLVAALTEHHHRLVVVLRAPAGWGKATLLADWSTHAQQTRPFSWLALDATDNDPVRFWSHLVEAVHRINPETGADASALLRIVITNPDLDEQLA